MVENNSHKPIYGRLVCKDQGLAANLWGFIEGFAVPYDCVGCGGSRFADDRHVADRPGRIFYKEPYYQQFVEDGFNAAAPWRCASCREKRPMTARGLADKALFETMLRKSFQYLHKESKRTNRWYYIGKIIPSYEFMYSDLWITRQLIEVHTNDHSNHHDYGHIARSYY